MIIKDLWIVSDQGVCFYHYKSPISNYLIDTTLFSGFVAALSIFTASLSDAKKIEYLKLQDDEMYFTVLNEIIVASIMNVSGVEQKAIDFLLKYIGNKFTQKYFVHMKKPEFNWESIAESFTAEIQVIWTTDDIYEKTKRDLISEFMVRTLEKEISPEFLMWKLVFLFQKSPPEKLEKILEKLEILKKNVFSMTNDPVLQSGIFDALNKAVTELSKLLPRKRGTLLVLSDDQEYYDILYKKALGYQLFCVPVRRLKELKTVVTYWTNFTPYNIVIISQTITMDDFLFLVDIQNKRRIYLWLKKIPPAIANIAKNYPFVQILSQMPTFHDLFSALLKET